VRKFPFGGVTPKSTFLEPTQWQGKEGFEDIEEDYCWPVSYVRSDAKNLGNGPSKLKVEASFKDMDDSPSLSFDVQLVGKLYQGGQLKHTLSFDPKTITTTGSTEKTEVFESTNGLPNVVGIWDLELEWQFSQSGSSIGSQRNPKAGTFQTLFTTWERPLLNGLFDVGLKAESMPTQYLEVIETSCNLLKGNDSSISDQLALNIIQDQAWSNGGYKYLGGHSLDAEPRGIDRFLRETNGLCEEFSQFYHALAESQGIDIYVAIARLPLAAVDLGYRIIPEDQGLVAFGGDTQISTGDWQFANHMYNLLALTNFWDLSFKKRGPVEATYLDNTFDLYDSSVSPYVPISPTPYSDGHLYLAALD
jgi:hypothetical protein